MSETRMMQQTLRERIERLETVQKILRGSKASGFTVAITSHNRDVLTTVGATRRAVEALLDIDLEASQLELAALEGEAKARAREEEALS